MSPSKKDSPDTRRFATSTIQSFIDNNLPLLPSGNAHAQAFLVSTTM